MPAILPITKSNLTSVSIRLVRVAMISVLTALSLATNYAMINIYNVKIMDALVFLGALLFGGTVGFGTAISTWTVYGFVNPNGSDDLLTLAFLMTGECFYAAAGIIVRRTSLSRQVIGTSEPNIVLLGVIGFLATFAYDVLTNFSTYIFRVSSLYQALLVGIITGVPFAIVHEASNLAFFMTIVPLAILALRRSGLPMIAPTKS